MRRILMYVILFIPTGLLLAGCPLLKRVGKPLIVEITATLEAVLKKSAPEAPIPEEKSGTVPSESLMTDKREEIKKPEEMAVIVSYFRFLNSLPEKALKQEYERTNKEFENNKSPVNRLRLVMILGYTDPQYRDTKQSLALLKSYVDDPGEQDTMLRDFSFMLSYFVQQMKNQEDEYQKITQQLKKGQEENEKLNKMIEELKTIEKNLMERKTTEKK